MNQENNCQGTRRMKGCWACQRALQRQLKCQQHQQALFLPGAERTGQGKGSVLGAQQPGWFGKNCGGDTHCVARELGELSRSQRCCLGQEPERNALGWAAKLTWKPAVLCYGEGCQWRENEKGKSQNKLLNEAQMRIERSQANKPETPCRLELLHLTRNISKF